MALIPCERFGPYSRARAYASSSMRTTFEGTLQYVTGVRINVTFCYTRQGRALHPVTWGSAPGDLTGSSTAGDFAEVEHSQNGRPPPSSFIKTRARALKIVLRMHVSGAVKNGPYREPLNCSVEVYRVIVYRTRSRKSARERMTIRLSAYRGGETAGRG